MFEPLRLRSAVLLAAVLLAVPALAAPPADPTALLTSAERVKEPWNEAVLKLRLSIAKPGAPTVGTELEVAVKGRDRSLIRFLGKDSGKLFLVRGEEAFLLLPGTKNPIKVPRAHRLKGGFASADLSNTRFLEDYDAVLEREDVYQERDCAVLRLTAKKGRKPSYPVVRVWVDRKESLYRKAVFLVASGRTSKEATFDSYRDYHGSPGVEKMTIVDQLVPGTTVVEYLDYEKRSLADAVFEVATARTQTW